MGSQTGNRLRFGVLCWLVVACAIAAPLGCGSEEDASTGPGTAHQELLLPPEANCVSGSFNQHQYWFCPAPRSWADARSKCQAVTFDLVRLDSLNETNFVRANQPGAPWIGGTDSAVEGAWRWTIGNQQFWSGAAFGSPVGGLFTNWAAFQPDNFANEDCARIVALGNWWEDVNCAWANPYVCESVQDLCPSDPMKVDPGVCGCGVSDTDTDGDGTPNCNDKCPNDATRLWPGDCGCSNAPRPAGTPCDDGLCAANTQCNGQGRCGNPAVCSAPDSSCTSATFADSHYWFCDNDRKFDDARQRCQSVGMDLTSIETATEDHFIALNAHEHSYIGASDAITEGAWQWLSTGASFWAGGPTGAVIPGAYSNWDLAEPKNDLLQLKDCAVKMHLLSGAKWRTHLCSLIADAFICEKKLPEASPPPDQSFEQSPFLGRTSQASNGSSAITPNPNYLPQHPDGSPRHDYCGAGLELTSAFDGIQVEKELGFPGAPSNTVAGDPDCHVEYAECTEDEQVVTPPPTQQDLNEPPSTADVCEAVPPSALCGIDESTIDFSPVGLCDVDEECLLRGMVCALVCADGTCESQEHRCARLSSSCLGLAEESPCITVRECAEPDATGDGDPGPHEMTGKPVSDLEELPGPSSETIPQGSGLPPNYTIGNPCGLGIDDSVTAKIPEQVEPRDANSGNDKWGVFIHPEIAFQADVSPQPVHGEAAHSVQGRAAFEAGAYVWGNEVEVLSVNGEADLRQCGATLERSVRIMGDDVAVGGGPAMVEIDGSECFTAASDPRRLGGNELKKSMLDALAVRDYVSRAGVTQTLCAATVNALGDPRIPAAIQFNGDCADPAVQQAAAQHWVTRYAVAIEQFEATQGIIDAKKDEIAAAVPNGSLPLLNFKRNFTSFAISFTYPVGPATVTVDIELGGSWGVFGDVTAEQTLHPTLVDARAALKPTLEATALAFAGVGFGPVSFGVGGELLIVGLQTPLQAGATIRQTADADPRPINLGLGVPQTGVPLAFDKTLHDWEASWTQGARAELTTLSGEINLQARIRLLFFKKTFKKRLAKWDGAQKVYEFVGGEEPFGGEPDFGTFEEQLAFVDPSWVGGNMTPPQTPVPESVPSGLGVCPGFIQ